MLNKLKKYLSFYFQLFGFDFVLPIDNSIIIDRGCYGIWIGQFEAYYGIGCPRCLFLLYYFEGDWQFELFWKRWI